MYNLTYKIIFISFLILNIVSVDAVMAATTIDSTTSLSISASSPVIITTPSDGGSASPAPTNVGTNVTFTSTAKEFNGTQYYLAVCKTQYVKVGTDAAPTCCTDSGLLTCTDSEKWAISSATNSESGASVTYTAQSGDIESNNWYAFVCDKYGSSASCFPANGSADQGLALGTITFSGIPVDGATLTIDSITYEFDTAGNGVTGGNTEVDTASAQVETDAAIALSAVEAGATSHMTCRSNIVYVYADTKGVGGNSIGMAEAGDTGNAISLSGANLSGGSDANASPFKVNHAGTFGSVTVTDNSDGTIEPGDTLKFKLPNAEINDPDSDGGQDTLTMYICTSATTSFDYGTNTCTGGASICSSSAVDPTTSDATCTGGASLVSVPTAHGSYDFKVYVKDGHNLAATGTTTQSYSVTDIPPTLSSYTAIDAPAPAAGGSDTVDFSAAILDNNGDNDVTAVEGVFFDDTAVDNNCTADENDCYIVTTCTLADKSTPGTGKTATGTDNALTANCQVTVWFNANASTNWEVHVNPTDGLGKVTNFADSNVNLENPSLSGIDIVQDSIAYGILEIGAVSARKETSMGNMGNISMDIIITGTNMCTNYPTCSGNVLSVSLQKWYHTDNDFLWSAAPTAPGPYILINTTPGTDDETGCLNRDIVVRNTHDSVSTNESIWWKLKIPETQPAGTYTGENTFATTASTTCTDAQSY